MTTKRRVVAGTVFAAPAVLVAAGRVARAAAAPVGRPPARSGRGPAAGRPGCCARATRSGRRRRRRGRRPASPPYAVRLTSPTSITLPPTRVMMPAPRSHTPYRCAPALAALMAAHVATDAW
jgi:hypothetical protein